MERISDKRIQQVIRESINELLLEYGGVSDEILEVSKNIFDIIEQEAREYQWKQSETSSLLYKMFSFKIQDNETLSDCTVHVKLFGYLSTKLSFSLAFDKLREIGVLNLGYSPSQNTIFIHVPYPVGGELDDYGKHYLLSSINHEVKHAYQSVKRKGTNISSAYQKSLQGKDFNDNESPALQLVRYWIKQCYYIFDLDEIDARLQEIYIDLSSLNDLAQSRTNQRIIKTIEDYNIMKSMVLSQDGFYAKQYKDIRENFASILQQELGDEITPKMFFNYCERGIQRYQTHLRRILGRYNEEQGITNGSFKQYSQNEIPQGEIFRKKPSLWQNLINKFKKR